MSIINTLLGTPLGYIIYLAYRLTGSYGLAIVIFAVVVRIVLFPVTTLAHRNSIRFLQIQPALHIVKQRYSGDKERLNEEQYELYKKEKYNPSIGLVPLFLQLFLIMGILQVIYNPLQHLLHLSSGEIKAITSANWVPFAVHAGSGEQLRIMEAIQRSENLDGIRAALSSFPDADGTIALISNTDLRFFGLNLGETPSLRNPTSALIVPIVSALSALVFCLIQNAISPGAISQSKGTNNGLTVFTVALSLYFALVTPVGVGIYWTMGNLMGIVSTFALNALYNPKKLAAEAILHIYSMKKTPSQLREERELKKKLRIREKADAARFTSAKKQLVFYALTGGQYKFYKNIIEYILENSDIVIHYLTNDPNDAVFRMDNPQLIPYYAGANKTISLMLRLDTDILATTVTDLQVYHIKRSVVRDDIEYIYVFHTITSTHLTLKEQALDNYDTLFCVGSHQTTEARRREEMAGLKKRNLVKVGYCLYDQLVESYAKLSVGIHEKPRILIAPSWQNDNILETCIDGILHVLIDKGYNIIVRPHPQFTNLFPERMAALADAYSRYSINDEITFDLDLSNNESIYASDILITDWSNIAYEFSYCTLKPCIFINTPMKVMNPNYEKYEVEVLDITLRDKVGISFGMDEIEKLGEAVENMLSDKVSFRDRISQTLDEYLFYPGRSGEAGGRYIIKQLELRT